MLSTFVAYPAKTTSMIWSRSTHIESAFFTAGCRSSRFFGLAGFEFQVMLVVSAPGIVATTTFGLFLTASTALNGTWSAQSMLPAFRSAITASEFV